MPREETEVADEARETDECGLRDFKDELSTGSNRGEDSAELP